MAGIQADRTARTKGLDSPSAWHPPAFPDWLQKCPAHVLGKRTS